jgi:alkylhydroperoxidase family enzyme
MWNSEILSRRARGLIFAVVARALSCSSNEAEARRLLNEDGLANDEIDRILDNLSSPILDEVESLVVPFARETVWYQPARLQRRARDLQAKLTAAQFVDFIAVAALANAICRLGAIIDTTTRSRNGL